MWRRWIISRGKTPPPPPPEPDFIESSINVFVARDNSNFLTLEQSSATADLTVTGKDGLDTINTGAGADIINGGNGGDTINSGAGNDVVNGGLGADRIDGGAGADILDGGNLTVGFGQDDRIVYKSSSAGVNVNITTNVVSGGDAQGDTISSFEGIIGSDFADVLVGLDNFADGSSISGEGGNDIITGGDGTTNFLYGGDGIDTITGGDSGNVIEGGAGADILDGGSGTSDRVRYFNSPEGVNVNLITNVVSGGHADGDTIINFERVEGSAFNDVLILDSTGALFGNEGDDTLVGGTQGDSLSGGTGVDNISGGAGDDFIFIYVNDSLTEDTVDGGDDIDTLTVDNGFSTLDTFVLDVSRLNANNIEILSMSGPTSTSIGEMNITIQDVLDITGAGNELRINEGVFINIEVNSTGQSWVQGADQVIDAETYNTYSAGGATLLIDADLTQDIS